VCSEETEEGAVRELTIHTVVYKQGDWWVIHGLEYHFVTCTKRLEDVPGEIRRWLLVLFAASQKYGVTPFTGYSPAPGKFWEMYERAAPWQDPIPPIELPDDFGLGPGPAIETRLAA
jgi:hypothetical protein